MNRTTASMREPIIGGVSLRASIDPQDEAPSVDTDAVYPWTDREFLRDPYPWYKRAQRDYPVFQDDTGVYVLSRYQDVMEFANLDCMSVEPGWDSAGPWKVVRSTVIGHDGAEHTRLKRQTTKWFAPRAVRQWTTLTKQYAEEILGDERSIRLDGWKDITVPVTHRTMCGLLDVDDADAESVMNAMSRTMPMLGVGASEEDIHEAEIGFRFLQDRADESIAAQRLQPGSGLIAELLEAERNGTMSAEEVRGTSLVLLGLGHMDVGYLVASGLRVFCELPEVYRDYKENEGNRDAIINEIVRMDPPELSFYRTTLEDISVRGVEIPSGSKIRFMIAAANRDPEIFEHPDVFDAERPPEKSRNLSFGLGTHTCVGQGLARAEARTIFDVVASRFDTLQLVEPFEMDNSDFSRHFTKLNIDFIVAE